VGIINRVGPTVVVVTDASLYHPIPFPSGSLIKRVRITSPSGGSPQINFYSRKFTGILNPIASITPSGAPGTNILVKLVNRIDFIPGDPITIAGTIAAYNGVRLALTIVDYNTAILQVPHTVDFSGGTAQLIIPTTDYNEWETLQGVALAQGVGVLDYPSGFPYRCADPQTNIGDQRLVYVKFASTGTYQIGVVSESAD
jgi:hypothetical protein